MRVPPVLVHRQDADLQEMRPEQAPAAAALPDHAAQRRAHGLRVRASQRHSDPALGLVQLHQLDFDQVLRGGARLDGDLFGVGVLRSRRQR